MWWRWKHNNLLLHTFNKKHSARLWLWAAAGFTIIPLQSTWHDACASIDGKILHNPIHGKIHLSGKYKDDDTTVFTRSLILLPSVDTRRAKMIDKENCVSISEDGAKSSTCGNIAARRVLQMKSSFDVRDAKTCIMTQGHVSVMIGKDTRAYIVWYYAMSSTVIIVFI
jgi:aspartyl aminopeptidase